MNLALEKKLHTLPCEPGVYLMKNKDGKVIYVGKAVNLKNRVSSYFRESQHNFKTKVLSQEIEDFEIIITSNEIEAIILERNLIKLHSPKYNVLLKDNKDYPYLRIDFNEPWPRIEKVRRKLDDGAFYLGPYGSEGALGIALRLAGSIFPLIRCSRHEFKNRKRPCSYYSMKMCLGPCTLPVDRQMYINIVKDAVAFLMGKNQELIKELQNKMYEASTNQQYELAAQYRDQLYALNQISKKQSAIVKNIKNADVFSVYKNESDVCVNVINIQDGKIISNENFMLNAKIHTEEEILREFLVQYYDTKPVSDEIICSHISEDIKSSINAVLIDQKLIDVKKVKISSGNKGIRKHLIEMSLKNAKYHIEQNIQIETSYKTELQILKDTLQLVNFPYRIECIDISNLQSEAIVGSVVCFINGKPAKDEYRRYEIKNLSNKQNDFASIEEVLKRRLERGIKESKLPNLMVIDGGPAQLNAALKVLSEFVNLQIDIISLAKSRLKNTDDQILEYSDERVYIPTKQGMPKIITLQEGSSPYRILTYIRDEAHRFALAYHRQKRAKNMFASELDSIRGVGPKIKKKLLEHFKGLENLKHASLESIMAVPGIKSSTAIEIYNFFKNQHNLLEK